MSGVHVIADPIHGLMDFTSDQKSVIKPVIDHRHFQRLRHIKQLGLADLVFPGAVHTRFNHCIGASFLAKRIATAMGFDARATNETILAALLHDIGHGPFSHPFESCLTYKDAEGKKAKVNHEMWTPKFLVALQRDSAIPQDIDVNKLASFIDHSREKHLNQADVISSQLDADRLDYLLRDSHFCGVSYGQYDLNWLIRCVQSVPETSDGPRLGIDRKGIASVEHFLMARRLMTKNVYYHRKVQVAEQYLVLLLQEVAMLATTRSRDSLDLPENLYSFLKASTKLNAGQVDANAFVDQTFDLYSSLTDFDVWSAARSLKKQSEVGKASAIASRLFDRKLPKCYPIRPESYEGAASLVKEHTASLGEVAWQVGIKQMKFGTYKSDKDPILVKDESGATHAIDASSKFFAAFADSAESSPFLWIDHEAASKKLVLELIENLRKRGYIDNSAPSDKQDGPTAAA